MIKNVLTWEGVPIEDLPREKLVEAVEYLAPFHDRAIKAETELRTLRVNYTVLEKENEDIRDRAYRDE